MRAAVMSNILVHVRYLEQWSMNIMTIVVLRHCDIVERAHDLKPEVRSKSGTSAYKL